jgi:hypothetical protein
MKHRLLASTIVVMISASLPVADASAMGWEFGVKAGATSATLHGNVSRWITLPNLNILTDLKDSRTGFTGGVYANVSATPMLSVQVEALYAQKGGSGRASFTRNNTTFVDADITIKLDYIEFPVLGMATFPAGPLGIQGYGGFAIAYNASSETVVEVGGTSNTIDIGALVTGTDISAIVGLAVSYGVGSVKAVADGRFDYSLKDINSAGTGDIRNGTFFLTAGVTMPMGF